MFSKCSKFNVNANLSRWSCVYGRRSARDANHDTQEYKFIMYKANSKQNVQTHGG